MGNDNAQAARQAVSAPHDSRSEWFTEARFGLYIHWGLYALGARHEWMRSREFLSNEEYEKYFRRFDPDLYDPAKWAKLAADAGMKYMVATAKHHEGFCLWDSKLTDYKASNTPYGKDLLHPMLEAFRSEGIRTGLYYSLLDWHHPDYTVDVKHPMRYNKEYVAMDAQRNWQNYVDYMHGQTRELLTEYGDIDVLFLDFSIPSEEGFPGKGKDEWQSERFVDMVRSLQPNALINDRLGVPGDITTPEQYQPREWIKIDGRPVLWEACHTFSGSWGYYRDEESWKSTEQILRMLIDTVSKGGNFLLNVGPNARGELDERAVERLEEIGVWMRKHERSIHGCTAAPAHLPPCPEDCRFTYNPKTNRLYLHLFAWPFKQIHLAEFSGLVEYAQLLDDASEIRMVAGEKKLTMEAGAFDEGRPAHMLTLQLPVKKPKAAIPVIELIMRS